MPHVASGLDGRAIANQKPDGLHLRISFDSQAVHELDGLGFGACAIRGVSEDIAVKQCPCYAAVPCSLTKFKTWISGNGRPRW